MPGPRTSRHPRRGRADRPGSRPPRPEDGRMPGPRTARRPCRGRGPTGRDRSAPRPEGGRRPLARTRRRAPGPGSGREDAPPRGRSRSLALPRGVARPAKGGGSDEPGRRAGVAPPVAVEPSPRADRRRRAAVASPREAAPSRRHARRRRIVHRAVRFSPCAAGAASLYPVRPDGSPVRCSHRLAAQDVALSRRKQGFESPWERQSFPCRSLSLCGPCRRPVGAGPARVRRRPRARALGVVPGVRCRFRERRPVVGRVPVARRPSAVGLTQVNDRPDH